MLRMISTCLVLLTLLAPSIRPPADPSAESMRDAARGLLLSLPALDRDVLENTFDEARLAWNYTPVDRQGMALGGLQPDDRQAVWAFLATGLGERGLRQARQIIMLEEVLYERSNGNPMRDPGLYWLNFYGAPATRGRWGWRFEGHHLSVSFTVLDDRIVGSTPAFFGGNPALVESGKHLDLRPFALEEDVARNLLQTLDAGQRSAAIIASTAHPDIVTANQHYVQPLTDNGVRYGDLSAAQRAALMSLLDQYAARLEPSLAERELDEIQAAGLENLRFTWAGGTESGEPHYYRIQGPTFVLEYDNTQSGANHVHAVWRNFRRDFGRDPLREHLASHHQAADAKVGHGHDHGEDR